MVFKILGPVEVSDGDRVVSLGPPKQRLLLAVLICRAGEVISATELADALWGARPPASAIKNIRTYVHRLRRLLGPGRIEGHGARGYRLAVDPAEVDVYRFTELIREGQESGDPAQAHRLFHEAIGLWRGRPFGDLEDEPALGAERARLEEYHLVALEHRIEADLKLGYHAQLTAELPGLIARQPYRERFRAQLMLALYRSGRRTDALRVYRDARRFLTTELGLEPQAELRQLELAILQGDPILDLPGQKAPPGPTPAQLPAGVRHFTGRAGDLARLEKLADRSLVVITGTAGVGKTALAVHWARSVTDRFPDGQLYVDLRGYGPGRPSRPILALSAFIRALGAEPDRISIDEEEAASLYRSLLNGRRVLVILDNAADAGQVRPLLPGGPECVVLVTSRDRLTGLIARDDASRMTLSTFTADESITLLAHVIGRERVEAEAAAAERLAAACGHLPLALRVAAANLVDRPGYSLDDYLAEFSLPALRIEGDELSAVVSAFDRSYATLSTSARRLFRLLGLVPGPDFTVEAAAALAGATPSATVGLLDRLSAAHLIDQPEPGRFALHDLLRSYAAERAARDDVPAARERLFDWYLDMADAAARRLYPDKLRLDLPRPSVARFDDHTQALTWLEAERSNLAEAVQHAAAHGPRQTAWLLSDALRGYFWLRTYSADWLAVGRAGLAAAQAEGNRLAQAAARLSIADVYLRQSRYRQAIEHYGHALTLFKQAGLLKGEAASLGNIGLAYWQLGLLRLAADHYRRALEIDPRTDWRAGQAIHLGNLGLVYQELGRLRDAADHHQRALDLERELGSRYGEALELGNLGDSCHALGRLDEALGHNTLALEIHREVGNRVGEADALRALAAVHNDMGRHQRAKEMAEAAMAVAAETGERRIEAEAANALARACLGLSQVVDALDHHQRALDLSRKTETRHPEVVALLGLAAARQRLGGVDEARRHASQALELATEAEYRVLEGRAEGLLAALALADDQPDLAREHAQRALALHLETGHRPGEEHARALLSDV